MHGWFVCNGALRLDAFGCGGFWVGRLAAALLGGLVVDHLLVVDYWLGSGVGCFWLALVGYWGLAGWDVFAVQTPVPKVLAEWEWGVEHIG